MCLLGVPGQAVVADEALRFEEGHWYGALAGNGSVEFDSNGAHTTFNSTWNGYIELVADAGVVTGGEWRMSGQGITHVETEAGTSTGHATFGWAGRPRGSASAPTLDGVAVMHMTTGGQTFDVTLTRRQTADPQLEIYTSDCSHVTGDWTAGISIGIEDNGGESDITGPFGAYNTTNSFLRAEVFDEFMADVGQFQDNVLAGNFQHGDLTSLILRSEDIQRLLRDFPECMVHTTPGFFALMVYALVRDLIDWVLEHPGQYDTDDLLFITRSAVRSGVLGAGAPDQDYARRTEEILRTAFDARLTQAISAGDRVEAEEIMELAIEMSWPDMAEKAAQWLNG